MEGNSQQFIEGFTTALIWLEEVFQTRGNAIYSRKWLRRKDIRLVIGIIDAMFRARKKMMTLGPRGMDLILRPDGSFVFREKEKKEKTKNDNRSRTDSVPDPEL